MNCQTSRNCGSRICRSLLPDRHRKALPRHVPGTARVSRVGFGRLAKTDFSLKTFGLPDANPQEKFATARTRSPTRATRPLPGISDSALAIFLAFPAATPTGVRPDDRAR